MKIFLQSISARPRLVFLLDGVGALVSVVCLLLILAPFSNFFGIKPNIAEWLSVPSLGFAVYSLSCALVNPIVWRVLLRIIALLNVSYCLGTATYLLLNSSMLGTYGLAYFTSEFCVVMCLAVIEWKLATRDV